MRWRIVATICVLLLYSTLQVSAHHSALAEFDNDSPIKVTGTVAKIEWQNPHVWFHIDVNDGNNKADWGFEMSSPNALLRSGWTRNSLKIGDVVTVEGVRARNGSNLAIAKTVTLTSNGRKLFAGTNDGATQ